MIIATAGNGRDILARQPDKKDLTTKDRDRLLDARELVRILSDRPYVFPGKGVRNGIYTSGAVVEWGKAEVAGILKAILGDLARTVLALKRTIM